MNYIYTLGPLVAWFVIIFVHAYLSYKEEMEIEADRKEEEARKKKQQPGYGFRLYQRMPGTDPCYQRHPDETPHWQNEDGRWQSKFGLLMPGGAYHKPGLWETHHLGKIDLHWYKDIQKLRQRLKKELLSIPADTEGRLGADLWKDLPPPDDEDIRLFNEYIYRTKEEMMRELGISVERDGRSPNTGE